METCKLSLTEKQMKKLATGGSIMVTPGMYGGEMEFTLAPSKIARMQKNHAAGKKYRLSMDSKEMKGGSMRSFLRKAGRTIKEGAKKGFEVWQTNYKPTYGPMIRAGLKEGLSSGLQILGAMTGQPELVEIAALTAQFLSPLIDKLGDASGAFGMTGGAVGQMTGGKKAQLAMQDASMLRDHMKTAMETAMRIAGKKGNKM